MEKNIRIPLPLMNSLVGLTVRQKKLLYSLLYRNPFDHIMQHSAEPSLLNLEDYQSLMSCEVDFYDLRQVVKSMESITAQFESGSSEVKIFNKIDWDSKLKEYSFYYDEKFIDCVFREMFSLG
jgi:hypothetical protein